MADSSSRKTAQPDRRLVRIPKWPRRSRSENPYSSHTSTDTTLSRDRGNGSRSGQVGQSASQRSSVGKNRVSTALHRIFEFLIALQYAVSQKEEEKTTNIKERWRKRGQDEEWRDIVEVENGRLRKGEMIVDVDLYTNQRSQFVSPATSEGTAFEVELAEAGWRDIVDVKDRGFEEEGKRVEKKQNSRFGEEWKKDEESRNRFEEERKREEEWTKWLEEPKEILVQPSPTMCIGVAQNDGIRSYNTL
jgi:hypothetical protein